MIVIYTRCNYIRSINHNKQKITYLLWPVSAANLPTSQSVQLYFDHINMFDSRTTTKPSGHLRRITLARCVLPHWTFYASAYTMNYVPPRGKLRQPAVLTGSTLPRWKIYPQSKEHICISDVHNIKWCQAWKWRAVEAWSYVEFPGPSANSPGMHASQLQPTINNEFNSTVQH